MGSGGNQHEEQRPLVLCAEHCHVPAWYCAVGTLATVVWAGGNMCQSHEGTEDKAETRVVLVTLPAPRGLPHTRPRLPNGGKTWKPEDGN